MPHCLHIIRTNLDLSWTMAEENPFRKPTGSAILVDKLKVLLIENHKSKSLPAQGWMWDGLRRRREAVEGPINSIWLGDEGGDNPHHYPPIMGVCRVHAKRRRIECRQILPALLALLLLDDQQYLISSSLNYSKRIKQTNRSFIPARDE